MAGQTVPTLNLTDFQTQYQSVPKGHPSNVNIGGPWWTHFANWHPVETGQYDNLANTFDTIESQHQAVLQNVQATRAMLSGMQGKLADKANGMLDDIQDKITTQQQANQPAAAAIRNTFLPSHTASHNNIEDNWNGWWPTRNNLNVCHAFEEAMVGDVRTANGQMLGLAGTLQNVATSSPSIPGVDNSSVAVPLPPAQPAVAHHAAPVATIHPAVAANVPGVAVTPAHATAAIPGAHHPGTVAAAQSTQVPGTIGSGSVAAAHHTVSSVQASQVGLNGTPANNVPTLASSGSATLAPPPAPTVATTSGAPMAAPVATAGMSGTGFGGVPFVPFAGAPGVGAGTRRGSDDDQESRKNRTGGLLPVSPATAGGRRPGATVRPGVAKRTGSTEAAAVAGGLRGRTDASTDRSADPAQRRATRSRRARGEESATVQFLDEDAWQIEDAGSGIVAANQPQPPGTD